MSFNVWNFHNLKIKICYVMFINTAVWVLGHAMWKTITFQHTLGFHLYGHESWVCSKLFECNGKYDSTLLEIASTCTIIFQMHLSTRFSTSTSTSYILISKLSFINIYIYLSAEPTPQYYNYTKLLYYIHCNWILREHYNISISLR